MAFKRGTVILVAFIFILIFFSLEPKALTIPGRIVVLYPAVSPLLLKLKMESKVVGTTRRDHNFEGKIIVGSHLRPNLELIKSLKPDLIIAGSKKAFPPQVGKRLKCKIFHWDPRTIPELMDKIVELGELLGKKEEALNIVESKKEVLNKIIPLPYRPRIVYEVMSTPLKVAGKKSIISSIISTAGGENIVDIEKKHVAISPELIWKLRPEIYIYQEGPMNKHPVPPEKRPYFKGLKIKSIMVDELKFARPGLNVFDAALELNRILHELIK